jgi:hypothetical protein
MEAQRFDHLARSLARATVRRRLLFGLALSSVAGFVARVADNAEAKKKRKKRKPKNAKPNAFGCLDVGDPCKSVAQCCSGICEGKRGKRTCRAHDTGTCKQGIKGACETPLGEAVLLKCNNDAGCFCLQTTAGSNYCAAPVRAEHCAVCATDADCLVLGYPPGSACAPVSQGHCSGTCESGMACLVPCGTPPNNVTAAPSRPTNHR